jgi:hypothetical protein
MTFQNCPRCVELVNMKALRAASVSDRVTMLETMTQHWRDVHGTEERVIGAYIDAFVFQAAAHDNPDPEFEDWD